MNDMIAVGLLLSIVAVISLCTQFASPNSVKQIVLILFMMNVLAILTIVIYVIKK